MTGPAAASSRLLDPEFVRELSLLRRRLKVDVRSGGPGEHVARRRGGSAEFREHRPYTPGDDLRRIDWLAFARSGTPVIKTFRAEEDVVVRLLLDASASLDFGNPRKIEVSRRIAAAIAYLALQDSERVQLLISGSSRDTRGLASVGEPRRGRGALHRVLSDLSHIEARGHGSLAAALRAVSERALRPGLLVVLSDFFDPGPVAEELSRLRAQGHALTLVQVLSRMELEPDFEGDLGLVDAETQAELEVTMDASAVEAYLARLAGLVEELRATARRLGGRYVRALTDEPLEAPVRRIVLGGED
ncbi:MAG TPA: DUF58 domain-containing protein [Polyangiaceae bacterium]|nr:DUF58 domain-containing protein [Polyangiaceae bacterium]